MANINVKLSQSVVNQQQASALNTPQLNGSIGALMDAVMIASYNVQKNYQYYSSWSLVGSTLRVNFSDGATKTYTGVVLDNPAADRGGATASGFEFYKNGLLTAAEAGTLNYEYSITPSATGYDLSLQDAAKGSTTTALRLATQLPTYSSAYDPVVGNVSILLNGAVNTSQSGQIGGALTNIATTADKFILSGTIEGNFQVAGNALSIGQQLTHTTVTGILTSYKEDYRDGSHAYVSGISTYISASQVLDETILSDASRFGGNDDINIDLPAHLFADFTLASGAGDDRISIKGGGGRLNVDAGSGSDRITILGDTHLVDGGTGTDIVFLSSARAAYKVQHTSAGYNVTDGSGAVTALLNVERIAFSDTTVAIDINGSGGQAYRLYQAAFNRAPDAGGLGFHIWAMETAGFSLTQDAQGFIDSPEFSRTYGSLNNRDFVTQLYANVLHRAPDAAGLKFHTDLLDAGTITRAADLVGFSESPENQAALIGTIGNGFSFIPYAG